MKAENFVREQRYHLVIIVVLIGCLQRLSIFPLWCCCTLRKQKLLKPNYTKALSVDIVIRQREMAEVLMSRQIHAS